MSGQNALLFILVVMVGSFLSACSDDDAPPRAPMVWVIPAEASLQEAADGAAPGDTLLLDSVFGIPPVTKTVTFSNPQTPLVIMSDDKLATISTSDSITVMRFDSPNIGTQIINVGFSGGANAIEVFGGGGLLIERCIFTGSAVQVRVDGSNLSVAVRECLMRNAVFFSVVTENRASVVVTSTTIDSAGDCGILLTRNTTAEVQNCIISNSARFGIACNDNAILSPGSDCNDVYNSGALPYSGCTGGAKSFDQDPLFCGGNDFSIEPTSPCSPDSSDGCGLIGAFDAVACNP